MLETQTPQRWLIEHKGRFIMHGLAEMKQLCEHRSAFQHIHIAQNPEVGKFLMLDGNLQSASADSFIYHECLVHPAMLAHPAPRKVAVLGGGEGATIREVLRYPEVEKVVMVELDPMVIELCRRHIPEMCGDAFEDPRLELIIGDAWDWLTRQKAEWDVIISDLTEPGDETCTHPLFNEPLFTTAVTKLANPGILAMQASCGCFNHLGRHRSISQMASRHFKTCRSYVSFIPSFNCHWAFLTASNQLDPKSPSSRPEPPGLRYYDTETHRRIFSLPRYFRKAPAPVAANAL